MASKVFGFFVKKTQSTSNINIGSNLPAAAADVPLPSSPTPIVTDLPATTTTTTKGKEKEKDVVQQLRTPSPSIDSASIARRTSPAPTTANNTSYSAVSTRQISEPLVLPTPVQTEPTQPALLPTSSSLTTLIKTVPPKTLHAYVLEQLSSSSASSDTLESLCAFFSTLTPPPKLHCVRCHKDFTEVENDDRSCLVPHDDESAEVERVGRGSVGMTMKAMYETLWGCCGKTSEGDGSQGPPEGWCYEGKHTTDVKRARFRADSTPLDDKLTSCLRLNCHGIRDRMPRRGTSTRKRARQTYREASTDEEGSEGESDSGVEITGKGKEKAQAGPARKKKAAPRKSKSKVKADEKEEGEGKEEDKMDVDQELQLQEGDSSTKGSSTAKAPANTVATPPSAPPKRRGRPPKRKVDEPTEDGGAESSGTVTPAPKRRGRPPKSKPLIEDSDVETAVSVARKLSLSPTRRGNPSTSGTPRTRSTSRGRQGQGQGGHVTRLAAEFNKRSESVKRPTPSKSRLGVVVSAGAEVGEDVDVDMEESHPTKKKRKVVS
ncbi:hypothetical protein BC629DRAFT_1592495 [Irpex lacteus]|nr:hypothetical protein BC629DRAFT_1592495 [Irpex lacteus]